MGSGESFVKKYDRSSLRILGSVGEPINPAAWDWYFNVVGEGKCAIVDTYWQTETGGIIVTPLPGVTQTKPGSATFPFFGIDTVLLDENTGQIINGGNVRGLLAIRQPWPSMVRTVWGNQQRYMSGYFNPYPGYYLTGDGCFRDNDGYLWITGRVDDVMKLSGHRLGTAEVESALVANVNCSEAAVIGLPHEIKGHAIYAFCCLKSGITISQEDIVRSLRDSVRKHIGPIATPEKIFLVPNLPKTRSGKIMRRLLRSIVLGSKDMGDISTLSDTSVVENIIDIVSNHK